MKIAFQWRDWWKAEGFGVLYATALCLACPVAGVVAAIADGTSFDPWFAWYGLGGAVWCLIYCGGWHLLVGGIAWLRARMGWITYAPAPDQLDRSDQ